MYSTEDLEHQHLRTTSCGSVCVFAVGLQVKAVKHNASELVNAVESGAVLYCDTSSPRRIFLGFDVFS